MEGFGVLQSLLAWLTNPNVAYLLLIAGLVALIAEISMPGIGYSGAIGVVCLILALLGLFRLPTNWVGVLLIVAGFVMLLLDLKIAGFALSIAALIALGLGSFLIFTPFGPDASEATVRLSPWLAIGATLGVELFFLLGLTRAVASQHLPVAVGRETIVGKLGKVTQELNPAGQVLVESEEWSAISDGEAKVSRGTIVRVLGVEGLTLRVQALPDDIASDFDG